MGHQTGMGSRLSIGDFRVVSSLGDRIDQWFASREFSRADAEQPRDEKGQFASTPGHISQLKQVGPQLGSNKGGQYANEAGKKFYVKEAKSAHHAANEVLAGHLYKAAGAPITQAHRIDLGDGKHGTVSAWETHEGKFNPNDEAHVKEAQKHFATHAWLANWDAIGLENDNQVPINGKLHTVDAGGAMKFRAQGGVKQSWGPNVTETQTMRDPKMGPQAAHVFGPMTKKEMQESSEHVAEIPDEVIHKLALEHGHGDDAERKQLAELLVTRKRNMLKELWP